MNIRNLLIKALGGLTAEQRADELSYCASSQFHLGYQTGIVAGRKEAKVHFRVLPLPFTAEQLAGAQYGEFITPGGFGVDAFGECNVPAPGAHGYEQRGYYVDKNALNGGSDLHCHGAIKFANPADSDALVPVIVTVLR